MKRLSFALLGVVFATAASASTFVERCADPGISADNRITIQEIFRQQGKRPDLNETTCNEVFQTLQAKRSVVMSSKVPDLSILTALPFLERLTIVRPHTDDFSPIATLVGLRELTLFNNDERPVTFNPALLTNLKELRRLHAWSLKINDLSALNGLTKLESLSLEFNEITDLTPLAGLTALKTLEVSNNPLPSLKGVEYLPALERLTAYLTGDGNLAPLAYSTELREVFLSAKGPCDVTALGTAAKLRKLDLFCQIVDSSPLGNLRGLTGLTAYVKDSAPIGLLTNLTRLSIVAPDEDLGNFAKLTKLTYLMFGGGKLKRLNGVEAMPLDYLNIGGNAIESLAPLAAVKTLRELHVKSDRNTFTTVEPLRNHPALAHLNIIGSPVAEVSPLAGNVNLQSLFLKRTLVNDLTVLDALRRPHLNSRGDTISLYINVSSE